MRAASKLPVCAGFGIRSREQVEQLRGHVAGVIVGSALVEVMENGQDAGRVPEIAAPQRRCLDPTCNTNSPVTPCSPCCIGGLSMVSPFSIDTFFPAFHAMEKALHVDALAACSRCITAYMVPFAFASLVHGPLSDAIGRRPVMIWGMVLYTVGSVACTLAPNYESLIAARMLQGATAGVGVVIGRAGDPRPVPRARGRRSLMSLTTMIFAIAPAVAPIIGGWAHVAFGWRAVFAFMVICGVIFTFAAWWRLPETHPLAPRTSFQCAQPRVDVVDGAAPPGIPDAGIRGGDQFLLDRRVHRRCAGHRREALGHERDSLRGAVRAGDRRHPRRRRGLAAASPARSISSTRCASASRSTFAVSLVRVILHLESR